VARWLDSPRPEQFDELLIAARAAAATSPTGRMALLNVIDADGKVPRFDEPVRRAPMALPSTCNGP
jgi:hypothetical protein